MNYVKPKKHLGQHFLRDENIAFDIANSIDKDCKNILEIGPGTGVLTKHLLKKPDLNLYVVEIDTESVHYLNIHYPELNGKIISDDFLRYPVEQIFNNENFTIIGNFPYNISSQILFRVLDYYQQIPEVVGMFQKEVAQRAAAKEGSKVYGVLSVLVQAFYDVEYLFDVSEQCFNPPPKVKSGVIRLTPRKKALELADEKKFFLLVKTAFNQRRKTLRNAVKGLFDAAILEDELFNKRAEQLTIEQFAGLICKMR